MTVQVIAPEFHRSAPACPAIVVRVSTLVTPRCTTASYSLAASATPNEDVKWRVCVVKQSGLGGCALASQARFNPAEEIVVNQSGPTRWNTLQVVERTERRFEIRITRCLDHEPRAEHVRGTLARRRRSARHHLARPRERECLREL
jgi:hypothetical protein